MEDKLKKQRKFYKNLVRKYQHRTSKSREFIENAQEISTEELKDNLHNLTRSPSIKEAFVTITDLIGSGTWISSAYLKHFIAILNFLKSSETLPLPKQEFIIGQVLSKKTITPQFADNTEIFQAIYNDLQRDAHELGYKSKLNTQKTKITVVLVSGVFTEIFKTAAFEAGTIKLCKEINAKYIVADVSGTKGVKHNAALLKKQLEEYITKHPTEKLWIVGFSKGGVDSLHYLGHNKTFANKHIKGISTIASPILGSNRADKKILRMFRSMQKLAKNHVFTKDKEQRDLFTYKLQKSLSSQVQGKWFKNNHKHLPKKTFYTAIGFRAAWHESHLGMIATKMVLPTDNHNDGVVDIYQTQFPHYFKAYNFGIIQGHHLIGYRSSSFSQDLLLRAHIIFLQYMKKL